MKKVLGLQALRNKFIDKWKQKLKLYLEGLHCLTAQWIVTFGKLTTARFWILEPNHQAFQILIVLVGV